LNQLKKKQVHETKDNQIDIFIDKAISSDGAFFDIGNLHCYFSDKISGKVVDPIRQCVR